MDSSLLFHSPLLLLGNFLSDLIQAYPYAANIKDAKTGQFQESNQYEANIAGISPSELHKLNIYDVGNILKLENNLIDQVVSYDQKVMASASSQCFTQAILEHSGSIRIGHNLKVPIFDSLEKRNVIAILSSSYDATAQYGIDFLFSLYKQYYPPKEAIAWILKYLKIFHAFQPIPTHQELIVLFHMRKNETSQYVAQQMNISHRTVDEYKLRLRRKLQMAHLEEVLTRLRVHHEYPILH